MLPSGYTAELCLKTKTEYLSVNVYPTDHGWMCVTMIHRCGKPWARLLGRVVELPLPSTVRSYEEALVAASDQLLALSEELARRSRASEAGAP